MISWGEINMEHVTDIDKQEYIDDTNGGSKRTVHVDSVYKTT